MSQLLLLSRTTFAPVSHNRETGSVSDEANLGLALTMLYGWTAWKDGCDLSAYLSSISSDSSNPLLAPFAPLSKLISQSPISRSVATRSPICRRIQYFSSNFGPTELFEITFLPGANPAVNREISESVRLISCGWEDGNQDLALPGDLTERDWHSGWALEKENYRNRNAFRQEKQTFLILVYWHGEEGERRFKNLSHFQDSFHGQLEHCRKEFGVESSSKRLKLRRFRAYEELAKRELDMDY